MRSRFSLVSAGTIFAVSLVALPASAHHGWAGNGDEQFELSGTVQKDVSLAGPHATMQIVDAECS